MVAQTPNVPVAGVNSAQFFVTQDSDLQFSGGEGAVVCRLVGNLAFADDTGAAVPHFLRYAFFLRDVGAGGLVNIPDLFGTQSVGNEDCLWMGQCIMPAASVAFTAVDVAAGKGFEKFDVKSKRRIAQDKHIVLFLQTAFATPTPSIVVAGYVRCLVMRPK